jgi:hypothetical protein
MGGALDLCGRHLMMAYNNQPRIGRLDNGDVRADVRGGRAHGETPFQHLGCWIEWQIHHGLRQQSIKNGSHNN